MPDNMQRKRKVWWATGSQIGKGTQVAGPGLLSSGRKGKVSKTRKHKTRTR